MKSIVSKSIFAISVIVVLLIVAMTPVMAADDNVEFSFTIRPANYVNSYFYAARYRQTTNVNNRWKVNLTGSNETIDSNTITTFWISKDTNHNVHTTPKKVTEGTGAHYYVAVSGVNQTDVVLSAEDNDGDGRNYTARGVWDEETN